MVKHLRCLWAIYRWRMPRWRDDKVAQMLGDAEASVPLAATAQ